MTSRWPNCQRAVVGTASLVQEADKLTLGQNLTLTAPHAILCCKVNVIYIYVCTMEYYSVLYNNETLSFVTASVDLKGMKSCEINQTQNDKYCMISLVFEISNKLRSRE